jgi:hypothetical protein
VRRHDDHSTEFFRGRHLHFPQKVQLDRF